MRMYSVLKREELDALKELRRELTEELEDDDEEFFKRMRENPAFANQYQDDTRVLAMLNRQAIS